MAEQEEEKIIEYCRKTVKQNEKTTDSEKKELGPEHDEHKYKLFNDPIHGSIQLNSLENAIINTPEYFRLKNIKQLGATYLVYPGATHTRFEHSLGVCYIAGEFVKHLNSKHPKPEPLISKEDEYCIRLAALCHDLGHGPFSHSFKDMAKKIVETKDKASPKLRCHEDLSNLIFKKILLDHPVVLKLFVRFGLNVGHVEKIENMINPNLESTELKSTPFLYEIVANKTSGGMDVDKWDYFARDCHYLGVTNEFDWKRCMALSRVVEVGDEKIKHIGFKEKEVNNILSMFRVRCSLHQRAYQHPAKNGIEMIIKEALVKVKDVSFIYCDTCEQQGYKSMKKAIEEGCTDTDDTVSDLSGYLCLNDAILDHILLCDDETSKAKKLIRRIMKRDLYLFVGEKFIPMSLETETTKFEIEVKKLKKCIQEFNTDPTAVMKLQSDVDQEKYKDLDKQIYEHLEIDLVPIKMPSEAKDNPIKEIYFFTETTGDYPEGKNIPIKNISQLNLPRAFVEYRVRLYLKERCKAEKKDLIYELFIEWIDAKRESWL